MPFCASILQLSNQQIMGCSSSSPANATAEPAKGAGGVTTYFGDVKGQAEKSGITVLDFANPSVERMMPSAENPLCVCKTLGPCVPFLSPVCLASVAHPGTSGS